METAVFPTVFPRDETTELPALFDESGERVKFRHHGFDPGDKLDYSGRWIVRDSWCRRCEHDADAMNAELGKIFEASNVLEAFYWLYENHKVPGSRWMVRGLSHYGSDPSFCLQPIVPECFKEAVPILLVNGGRVVKMSSEFDDPKGEAEEEGYEVYEIPNQYRRVYGVLIPHPGGGDQLVYCYQTEYDGWKCSTKPPKPPKDRPDRKPTPADQLLDRMRNLQCELYRTVSGFKHAQDVGGMFSVSGSDYPQKFKAAYGAVQYVRDHKGWSKNFKRLRPTIRAVLESLENRMSLRRNESIAKVEKFFCKLVKKKLKPVRAAKAPTLKTASVSSRP